MRKFAVLAIALLASGCSRNKHEFWRPPGYQEPRYDDREVKRSKRGVSTCPEGWNFLYNELIFDRRGNTAQLTSWCYRAKQKKSATPTTG